MKLVLIFSALVAYSQAGIVPASTTLIRQSTSIAHHPAFAYSSPVALSYSAPVYTHYTPADVYSQHLLAPAQYTTQFYGHHFLPQHPIYAQYPAGVIAQYPAGVIAQYPQQQFPSVQGQEPVQGASPVIEPAQNEPQQPAPPQNPSQPSGGSPNVDDDTVSVEAA